jgi:hypothetical protein
MTEFAHGFVIGSCLGLALGGSLGFVVASILMATRGENISYNNLGDEIEADQEKLQDLSKSLENVEV